ncbi:dual specificity protein phosphatase family protein [bacterium]|nr:dual specificity protein phosphatase family protein [bacterium]MBU1884620.1 dual specificity protein phosphatase family protein [bacterium]
MKKVLKFIGFIVLAIGVYYVWHVNFNYRFEEISKDKVYKSALIDPDKLGGYLQEYKIKTVIDLLDPGVQDRLNPGKQANIDAEANAVKKYDEEHNATVLHVNIPSGQVPTKETLTKFFQILDDKSNYPVLIHCYHGTGRAQIYSALYRIEYEKWNNAEARDKTRFMVQGFGYRSSFADGKSKGDFLMHYKPRSYDDNATINQLK